MLANYKLLFQISLTLVWRSIMILKYKQYYYYNFWKGGVENGFNEKVFRNARAIWG